MMDIYNYAPNGEYIGASKADPDPLESGEWLIPAYATTLKPPKAKAGMAAVFDGSAWALVEDHRKRSGWIDGQPATIVDLGPLPDGWNDDAPSLTPEQFAERRRADLAEIRYRHETGGITVAGAEIDTSRESQALINGAVALADRSPETIFKFKSKAGFVDLNAPTIVAIGVAVGLHVQACYAHEADLAAQINALADDPDALAALNLEQGWPA